MGWHEGHHPRFDMALVPILPLVAVELTVRDAGGSVAHSIYCPGTHDSPGEVVDYVEYILGAAVEEAVEDGILEQVQLAAVD